MTDRRIENETQLDAMLAKPSPDLVRFMGNLQGDLVILGIAGKMGVSLGELAVAAIAEAGTSQTVYGVARFSDPSSRERLETAGVKTISCDLMDPNAISRLPLARNVIFMAGRKFGTGGDEPLTWAINVVAAANAWHHYRDSNMVAFSTGCVYPLASVDRPPSEATPVAPVGEYAQSCLGRERVFQYGSLTAATPVCLFRLNYAIDLRYGVLHDIAHSVWNHQPVDGSAPAFNMIWQGDANRFALLCLGQCTSPANLLNVTGPETLDTRSVALRLGELLDKPVTFTSNESSEGKCYLSDSSKAFDLFGLPTVTADQLIRWQAGWFQADGRSLGKPTHFEVTDGAF